MSTIKIDVLTLTAVRAACPRLALQLKIRLRGTMVRFDVADPLTGHSETFEVEYVPLAAMLQGASPAFTGGNDPSSFQKCECTSCGTEFVGQVPSDGLPRGEDESFVTACPKCGQTVRH